MCAPHFPLVRLLAAVAIVLVLSSQVRAQTCSGTPPTCVATTSTELSAAIGLVNASGGTIRLGSNITLAGNLAAIDLSRGSITVDGGGFTLSGANQFQGLTFTNSAGNFANTAAIQNLTIVNALAAGGAGANGTGGGSGGGGGGAGAGGALYVGSAVTLTVNNINLIGSSAVGGAGGISGTGAATSGGAGGGLNGGTGGGTAGNLFSFPAGGAYGGGGGGAGPVGGTGAMSGGAGGFGGGAGGSNNTFAVAGGFGAGGNNGTTSGGGGAGLGGAVFVASSGHIQIRGPFTVNGNSVTAGAGGTGAASGSALGAGLFLDGGFVDINTTSTVTISDAIGGSGASIQKSGTGTLVLTGNNTYTGSTNVGGGALSISSDANLGTGGLVSVGDSATLAVTAGGTYTHAVTLGLSTGGTVNVASGQTATWNGVFNNGDGLTGTSLFLTGGGTLVLGNSANNYRGSTVVTGGSTASVSADSNLGLAAATITLGNATTSGTLAITTNGAFSSARNVSLGAGGGIFDTSSATAATLSGVISGSGSLTKNGAGRLTLFGANSYSGATFVNAGTLAAGATNVFGSAPALTVASGATVDFGGFSQTLNTVAGTGTLALGSGTLSIGSTNASSTFGGTITGATGGIVKGGTGTLTLSGTNTFGGGINLVGGTLAVSTDANLGTGTTSLSGGTTLSLLGSGTFARNLFLTAAPTVSVGTGNTATWNGTIADGGSSGALQVTGGGTLVLGSASNTYSGGTIATGGSTVSVAADGSLGAAGLGVTLGGASSSGTLAIAAAGAFSSSRTVSLGVGGGTIDTSAATSATLSGAVTGSGGLTKSGAGSLTLSGANTYTGGTTVSGGTLIGTSTSLPGNIVNNAAVSFDQTFAGTYAGVMSGSGSLTKSGSGSLTLGGANTYTGGTTVSGGTLIGTTTSLQGNILNNAAVAFNQPGAGTYAGVMSGTGSLTWSGPGTLTLSGANTYSGGTVISSGTLVGTSSSVQGNIANNGAVVFNQASAGTYAGAMSGSGSLTKNGSGALTLGGANTYSGGTFLNAGTLIGTSTSLQGGIVNNAAVIFDQGFGGTYGGAMSGSGSLTKNGSGTLTLSGSNTYSGLTTVNAGTLRAGSANAFGTSGLIAIGAGGVIDLNGFNQSFNSLSGSGAIGLGGATLTVGTNGSSFTFGGALTGAGSLVKNGGGTLALTGANSYTGGTTVNGGTLFGTASSIQGNIVNNASVVFDQAGTGTYAGSMSGIGSLTKNGTGTLTLSGTNTYTGGTVIASGTLVGDSSSLQGNLLNNGALVFNEAGAGSFNGTIFGTGSLTKSGTGTLTINGANPFSGTLSIGQGTLALNGAFGGDITIGVAGSLRGSGTIGGSLNLAGGSLFVAGPGISAPLSAMRLGLGPRQTTITPSITINGNLTATSGALLDFTVTPNGTAPIVVKGLASLTNTNVSVTVNDPSPARYATYLGLTSSGLTVNGINATSPTPGIVPVLKSDPNYLYFTVLNENIPLGGIVSSGNAAGAGNAIDRVKLGASGDLAFVVRELTALDNTQLNNALRQISGELHATQLRLTADESLITTNLVRDSISDRQDDEQPGGRTTGAQSIRWWFQFTGDHGRYSPGGFDTAVANSGGGGGGLDFRPTQNLILGGGGSYSLADMSMLGLGGSSNMQAPRAFGYGGYTAGPFAFNGGGSASRTVYTTKRPIAFQATIPGPNGPEPLSTGINREADADQSGTVKDTWTEIKDTFRRGSWVYNWKVGWRAATYSRNPFTESGAGALSLVGLADVFKTKEADVNIHAFRRSGTWRPRILLSYRRELGDLATNSNVQLGGQSAGDFIVNGVPIPQSEFHGLFGLTMRTSLGFEYTIEYETRVAKDENHQGVHFRVRFK